MRQEASSSSGKVQEEGSSGSGNWRNPAELKARSNQKRQEKAEKQYEALKEEAKALQEEARAAKEGRTTEEGQQAASAKGAPTSKRSTAGRF